MRLSLLKPIGIGLVLGLIIITLKTHWSQGITQPASNPTSPSSISITSFNTAIQKAAPAVVNIYTTKTITKQVHPLFADPFFQRFSGIQPHTHQKRMNASLGSGVIVNDEGYVITNNHVIKEAEEIVVALYDGREQLARIVGIDPETDLAILKIELPSLPAIELNLTSQLHIGDIVLAIGNPFGIGQTTTMGIVSATGRAGLKLSTYENFIQTDASINPGNSGGALIDAHGKLVGINTAIYSKSGGSQGIGFAIPISIAHSVLEQIIQQGSVVRGWVGIIPKAITKNLHKNYGNGFVEGIIIADVFKNGPAHLAGIRSGDIVTHFNNIAVEDLRGTMLKIAIFKPGDQIIVKLIRKGDILSKELTIGVRP